MRQCAATAEVPPAQLLLAILAGQHRVSDNELVDAPWSARCELALWHEGEHADYVWEWRDKPTQGLWARWATGGPMRFGTLTWCEIPDGPDSDACTLYRDHARDHSWNVFDPKVEAFRRRVLAENAELIARLSGKPN